MFRYKWTALIYIFFLTTQKVLACTCEDRESIREQLLSSDYVFLGKVLDKRIFLVYDKSIDVKTYQVEYTIHLTRIYKGRNFTDTLKVISPLGDAACGVSLLIGKEYIVYALYSERYFPGSDIVPKHLHTNICMRTMEKNKDEMDQLSKLLKVK